MCVCCLPALRVLLSPLLSPPLLLLLLLLLLSLLMQLSLLLSLLLLLLLLRPGAVRNGNAVGGARQRGGDNSNSNKNCSWVSDQQCQLLLRQLVCDNGADVAACAR